MIYLVLAAAAAVMAATPSVVSAQAPAPAPAASTAALDFEFFRTKVEPIFLAKRAGNVRCVNCHAPAAGNLRLQPLAEGVFAWTEEQSRKNFEAVARFVVPGSPRASRLLRHPLSREAGGDSFHGGGKHWQSQDDPEWQILSAWVSNTTKPVTRRTAPRIIQTNSAGDVTHVIDPATNAIVGTIVDTEMAHGVTTAPDGSRIYLTNEHLRSLDVVDAVTFRIIKRVPLSGRPNNLMVTPDGKKVYAGIAQAPGALDVIDTVTLTNIKTVPVKGAIHNAYVTPDGKYAVAGSIPEKTISVVDTKTDELAWTIPMSAGIRPMTFETNADGSTKRIYVQLSDYNGVAVVDWESRKEVTRWLHSEVPGAEKHTDGLQAAPAHGLGIPDGKHLWSTSKVNGYAYVYNLSDFKEVGRVFVGQHPEWFTFTPDGKTAYVAAAGDNQVYVVDVATLKVVTKVNVGQVPKRNGTGILQLAK